jgi:hypothetical protein
MTASPSGRGPDRAEQIADLSLVVMLTFMTALAAGFAVFFLPSYSGSFPLPVSGLLGAAVVFVTVRLCFRLNRSMAAAFAPALAWFAVTLLLGASRTLGYALVIQDWRFLLLLGVGSVGAAGALGLCWGSAERARLDAPPTPPMGGTPSPAVPTGADRDARRPAAGDTERGPDHSS